MPFFRRSGKRVDHLTSKQRDVVQRLERGELSAEEAARLLAEAGPEADTARGGPSASDPSEAPEGPERPPETPDETAARELVERIAREAYGDPPA
jgi:hypothetical protein